MKTIFMIFLAMAVMVLQSAAANAQCSRDVDCKGERVCQGGECVDPPPPPEPAPAPAPAPAPVVVYTQPAPFEPAPPPGPRGPLEWWKSGYGSVNFSPMFHGWGGGKYEDEESDADPDDVEMESDFWGGVYIGGYGAISENFHIGGFWAFYAGDGETKDEDGDTWFKQEMKTNVLGLSMKFGGAAAERIWIGGAVDLAAMFTKSEVKSSSCETETMVGLWLFPRFVLDIMLLNAGSFKLAINTGVGAMVSPIYGGHPLDNSGCGDEPDIKATGWSVGPGLLVGLAFGG
jgi:hypothetical protein